jgi:O-antigen/teichoic acid export membrane protein
LSTLRRQGSWAVADQALSSGTNFVPIILLARYLGPAGYGNFSLVFLSWFGALALIRSALMQPFTLAAASTTGAVWKSIAKRASGAVVLAGLVSGGVFVVVAAIVGVSTDLGKGMLVVAVLAPGLALQEFWRIAAYSASRARTAFANDAVWALGQVVAFSILLWRGNVTVTGSLVAWGAGAVLAAAVGVVQLSVLPRIDTAAIRWAREWAAVGAWFTLVSATFTVGALTVAIVIAAQTGSEGLGLFRTVQNLFGPVQLLTIGAESAFLPYLVRTIKNKGGNGVAESRQYSLLMAGAVGVYGIVMLVAAYSVLTRVFGPEFASASVLVFPTMVAFVLDAAASGASLRLRAGAMGRPLFVAQLLATIARVGAVAVLATAGGLRAGVWGLVVGSGVGCVAMWAQVARGARQEVVLPEADASPLTPQLQLAETD